MVKHLDCLSNYVFTGLFWAGNEKDSLVDNFISRLLLLLLASLANGMPYFMISGFYVRHQMTIDTIVHLQGVVEHSNP